MVPSKALSKISDFVKPEQHTLPLWLSGFGQEKHIEKWQWKTYVISFKKQGGKPFVMSCKSVLYPMLVVPIAYHTHC